MPRTGSACDTGAFETSGVTATGVEPDATLGSAAGVAAAVAVGAGAEPVAAVCTSVLTGSATALTGSSLDDEAFRSSAGGGAVCTAGFSPSTGAGVRSDTEAALTASSPPAEDTGLDTSESLPDAGRAGFARASTGAFTGSGLASALFVAGRTTAVALIGSGTGL